MKYTLFQPTRQSKVQSMKTPGQAAGSKYNKPVFQDFDRTIDYP
jgi:hypothetical protein